MRSFRLIIILSVLISFSFLTETWYSLHSPEFGFNILFPEKPTVQHQIVSSAIGELKMNMYILDVSADESNDNLMYLVNYTEYPDSLFINKEEILTKFFRGSVDGMIQNVKGELLSEKIIELNGFPGREVKVGIQNGAAIIHAQMYLVKNKMYLIETITDAKKDSNESLAKFFGSFQLR